MTKRFSPKASDYTVRLATVQANMVAARRKLAELETEERALKAFLLPFYDEGVTTVEAGNRNLTVNFGTTFRSYMDQEKARLLIAKLGKKVPEFSVDIITFKAKFSRG